MTARDLYCQEVEVSLDKTRDGSRVGYPNAQGLSNLLLSRPFFVSRLAFATILFVGGPSVNGSSITCQWLRRMQTLVGVGDNFTSQQG